LDERRLEAFRKRPGWPDDPMLWNGFFSYKGIPKNEDEAHLDFPDNFNIENEACVLAIFNRMTEEERRELRKRILERGE
jgi:hypothetical protein